MGAILSDFAQEGGPAIYHDEQRVTLAGVITASRTKTTRNNSLMAYVTLEDDTASMEMLVFARVLGEAGPYLKEGVAVLAEGRISVRDEKAPQLMCDRVRPLDQVKGNLPPVEGEERAKNCLLYTSKQPLEWPSGGSTFKRPEGHFAAALIEGCGLKGVGIGGAQVSEKHAGFVVNRGGATAQDVLRLCEAVQERVFREQGVQLEPEVRFIGEF